MDDVIQKAVTIITGHLGSGKTTFIKEILKSYPDKNFLVIENEFGEIGIDGEVLSNNENALIELNSGCICCNIQSDLQKILLKIIEDNPNYDHILIEATGVANPAKIAMQFVPTGHFGNYFNLNSVICVIDSLNYERHQKLPEFELQLLTSDSYYISKLNDYTEVSEKEILQNLSVSPGNIKQLSNLKEWFFEQSFFGLEDTSSHSKGHKHYQKLSYEIEGEFNAEKLQWCLNVLFRTFPNKIFRSKGLVFFAGRATPLIMQGVFDAFAFDDDHINNLDYSKEKKLNQIVIIGDGLDEEMIGNSFRNCIEL